MHIRPTTPDDIPILVEYWYDNMVLLQQTHGHYRLQPKPETHWQQAMHTQLVSDDTTALTCVINDEPIGCIVGRITNNRIGLLPEKIAIVEQLFIDLHTPTRQQGIGTQLWHALRDDLQAREIKLVRVDVPRNAAVQQAFWRGIGAKKIEESFEIDV